MGMTMQTFARISNDLVEEIITLPEGVVLEEAFHSDLVATIKLCGSDVREGWSYDGADFSSPSSGSSIEDVKAERIQALSTECERAIVSGYTSSALGEPHSYPCAIKDQINMSGSVLDSLMPGLPSDWNTPFWCAPAGGEWSYRPHTAAEIQQAGRDGKAHVISCQQKLKDLSAAVAQAATADAVAAIAWAAA